MVAGHVASNRDLERGMNGPWNQPIQRPLRLVAMTSSAFVRDSRHAVRALLRTPAFTAIAALTFALGIGVNTAVFSVFNGVLLRPLPYPEPDRITMVWMDNRQQGIKEDITSWPNYRDWRDQSSSFAAMAGFSGTAFNLTGAEEPERLQGAQTTANFFDVMGVRPLIGRLYTEANETPGNDGVVLISYGLWQRRFGGAGDVLGKTMTLNGRAFEIIGVMPGTLQVPAEAQLWKPLAPDEGTRNARGAFWLPVIGRLKPGIPVEQAQTEMTGIATRLEQTYPSNQGFGINVVPLHRQLVGDIERSLVVLLASVGFVLLIACANLGNLMLGRTAARRKELAIRTALGANRAVLVRQIVTEAFVLAAIGGALGLMFAYWATRLFVRIGGDSIPRPDAIAIDGRVMLFTLAIAVVAALLAGIVPALQASRPAVVDTLAGRRPGRRGRREPPHTPGVDRRRSRARVRAARRRRPAVAHVVEHAARRPRVLLVAHRDHEAEPAGGCCTPGRPRCGRSTRGSWSACARCLASNRPPRGPAS